MTILVIISSHIQKHRFFQIVEEILGKIIRIMKN